MTSTAFAPPLGPPAPDSAPPTSATAVVEAHVSPAHEAPAAGPRKIVKRRRRAPRTTPLQYVWRTFAVLLSILFMVLGGFRLGAMLRETASRETFAPAAGQFIQTPGGVVFVQQAGPRDGIAVVLLHGAGLWSETWRSAIDQLASERRRVVAIDLPPFGFSDRSATARYSRADQVQRIFGVLDNLGIAKAVVVAHSWSAGAAVEAALRHPDRMDGMILVSANLGLSDTDASKLSRLATPLLHVPGLRDALVAATLTNPLLTRPGLERMMARKEAATVETANLLRRPLTRADTTRDWAAWAHQLSRPEPGDISTNLDLYPMIGVKTRLVWGDQDAIAPLRDGVRIAKLIPGARLSLMREVGHLPHLEDEEYFLPILSRLVTEVAADAR